MQNTHFLLDLDNAAAILIHVCDNMLLFHLFPFLIYEERFSLEQLPDYFYVLLSPLYVVPVSDAAGVKFVEVAQDMVYPL